MSSIDNKKLTAEIKKNPIKGIDKTTQKKILLAAIYTDPDCQRQTCKNLGHAAKIYTDYKDINEKTIDRFEKKYGEDTMQYLLDNIASIISDADKQDNVFKILKKLEIVSNIDSNRVTKKLEKTINSSERKPTNIVKDEEVEKQRKVIEKAALSKKEENNEEDEHEEENSSENIEDESNRLPWWKKRLIYVLTPVEKFLTIITGDTPGKKNDAQKQEVNGNKEIKKETPVPVAATEVEKSGAKKVDSEETSFTELLELNMEIIETNENLNNLRKKFTEDINRNKKIFFDSLLNNADRNNERQSRFLNIIELDGVDNVLFDNLKALFQSINLSKHNLAKILLIQQIGEEKIEEICNQFYLDNIQLIESYLEENPNQIPSLQEDKSKIKRSQIHYLEDNLGLIQILKNKREEYLDYLWQKEGVANQSDALQEIYQNIFRGLEKNIDLIYIEKNIDTDIISFDDICDLFDTSKEQIKQSLEEEKNKLSKTTKPMINRKDAESENQVETPKTTIKIPEKEDLTPENQQEISKTTNPFPKETQKEEEIIEDRREIKSIFESEELKLLKKELMMLDVAMKKEHSQHISIEKIKEQFIHYLNNLNELKKRALYQKVIDNVDLIIEEIQENGGINKEVKIENIIESEKYANKLEPNKSKDSNHEVANNLSNNRLISAEDLKFVESLDEKEQNKFYENFNKVIEKKYDIDALKKIAKQRIFLLRKDQEKQKSSVNIDSQVKIGLTETENPDQKKFEESTMILNEAKIGNNNDLYEYWNQVDEENLKYFFTLNDEEKNRFSTSIERYKEKNPTVGKYDIINYTASMVKLWQDNKVYWNKNNPK